MDAGKYLSIVRQPWKKIARGITKPVELLYGEDDPYRLSGLYLKKFVPGAHGHWQDHKGGHFPPKEAWEGSRDGDTQLPGIFERVRDAVIAQNAQSEQTKNPS